MFIPFSLFSLFSLPLFFIFFSFLSSPSLFFANAAPTEVPSGVIRPQSPFLLYATARTRVLISNYSGTNGLSLDVKVSTIDRDNY